MGPENKHDWSLSANACAFTAYSGTPKVQLDKQSEGDAKAILQRETAACRLQEATVAS